MLRILVVVALWLALMPQAGLSADTPRNVLLIMSDDLTARLGCYGDPLVKTPNLDALARRGVLFANAHCQYALCNPSRASLMTGRSPDATKVYDNSLYFRKTLPDVVTMSQLFKNNGYYAARVGKIYHYGVPSQIGTAGLDDEPSWTLAVNPSGHDHLPEVEKKIINYGPGKGLGAQLCWLEDEGDDSEQTDGKVASETIRLLREHKDKPFFLAAGFYRPHVPDVVTKKWFDLYPLEKIQLPKEPEEHFKLIPKAALLVHPLNYGVEPDNRRRFTRAYFAAISFMDAQVGLVLDELERLKLTDKTVVVFVSDHGWQLGEHGQWQKRALFERSTRVPMIIAGPGVKSNLVCRRPVQLLDVYPTVADLCGLKPAGPLDGHSLRPLLDNPESAWNHAAHTVVQTGGKGGKFLGRTVRTDRYRYTEWGGGEKGVELYDYENDPHEFKNLAGEASKAELVKELKALLPK